MRIKSFMKQNLALLCIDLQKEYFNKNRPLFISEGNKVLKNGAQHTASSTGDGVNYGYEQFIMGITKIHVLNMLYGGGCCNRFRLGQCGEGIRYPRVIYTGEVKPCLYSGVGVIKNDSTNLEIGQVLEEAKQFIRGLSVKPFDVVPIKPHSAYNYHPTSPVIKVLLFMELLNINKLPR